MSLAQKPSNPNKATENMKEGDIIANDSTGIFTQNPIKGASYKLGSLPIGTKICFVEKVPGRGPEFALTQGRYGIIMGRIDRLAEAPLYYRDRGQWKIKELPRSRKQFWERKFSGYQHPPKPDPLVIVSFPYLSPSGYTINVGDGKMKQNFKGDLDEHGLHTRMGGKKDETWTQQSVEPNRRSARNSKEEGAKFDGEWKSYFKSMATHRENIAEMSPESMVEQDFVLDPECVVTGKN